MACGELLAFEEVARLLGLGTRLDGGREEIQILDIVGSVGRVREFDGCFRPRSVRLRRVLDHIGSARPEAPDTPITVYRVDSAYFVLDGHKRVSLAISQGRQYIDAEVTVFPTRFHVDARTTMGTVRATADERRFREITGLASGVPDARFPLSDPAGYLELMESVTAHAYDLSEERGAVVPRGEAARHWYGTIFLPCMDIAESANVAGLLTSLTAADLFLLLRRGITDAMGRDWQIPEAAAAKARSNLRRAGRPPLVTAVRRLVGTRRRGTDLLDER
ncbi:MAG TPA: hypothetical protein VFK61_01610 [Candidatus Limnocylindria bacterium]|nr:hypothetical protein [Candidatus Limnocylindria bacterium]